MSSEPASYELLAGPHEAELIVNKSRFLCLLSPVHEEAEAQALIAARRAAHPNANHSCYAYLIGPAGSSARVGLSDDGEPHGVAGRPMLNILTHSGVGDILAVVTRYFGGIKLGRGGMVRAYSQAVKDALQTAPTRPFVELSELSVKLGYAEAEAARRLYPELSVELVEERFAERVEHQLRLPASELAAVERALSDLCRGQLSLKRL